MVGDKPLTGFEGNQSKSLAENHEIWSYLLHSHPRWADIKIVLDCVCRIIAIAHTFFKKDDPIIDEFENLINTLRDVVVKSFNGRIGDAHIEVFEGDDTGYRFKYTGIDWYNFQPGRMYWPHMHFKNGFYEYQVYDDLVKFMRINGDILKYSSWVIEAANKDWKRILCQESL